MIIVNNPTTVDRFIQYVVFGDAESDCWSWTGPVDTNGGYARLSIDGYGTYIKASHIAWEIEHRCSVPADKMVLHTCDNRLCCNIHHLYLGTALDNARDRDSRGRASNRQGMNHHMARLTEDDVLAIRALRDEGCKLQTIAEQFGVSDATVSAIVNRKRWAHV